MQLLNGTGFQKLENALGAANIRQRVIANNVANVDTPYFKRSEVSFESLLKNEISNSIQGKRTDYRHFAIGQNTQAPEALVTKDEDTAMNNNMNNVDIDKEMSLLAENQLQYNAYIELINHRISMMKTAIDGRA